jgi:hypothetical protein
MLHFNVMFIAKMCKPFLQTAVAILITQHGSYKHQNYALAQALGHRFSLMSLKLVNLLPPRCTLPSHPAFSSDDLLSDSSSE